jgi:putative ABC transport system substrate-binding protein
VVGFLNGGSPDGYAPYVIGFLHGLNETGYVEVNVAVIAANTPAAPVAKASTTKIPIVFVNTGDPVKAGLVTSFNRPGGNVTGVSLLGPELETKRLELLNQLIPGTTPIDVLVNPTNPAAEFQLSKLQEAAGVIERQIDIVRASTASARARGCRASGRRIAPGNQRKGCCNE